MDEREEIPAMVDGTQDDRSGDWAQGLRPVTRSRVEARNGYDGASRWYRFLEEPFERRAQAVGLDLLHAQPGGRVVDLGCGAGVVLGGLSMGEVQALRLGPSLERLLQ